MRWAESVTASSSNILYTAAIAAAARNIALPVEGPVVPLPEEEKQAGDIRCEPERGHPAHEDALQQPGQQPRLALHLHTLLTPVHAHQPQDLRETASIHIVPHLQCEAERGSPPRPPALPPSPLCHSHSTAQPFIQSWACLTFKLAQLTTDYWSSIST